MTFEEFVTAHARTLIGFAVAMSGDRHLSEDLVQDVLIKAYQRWDRIAMTADPFSYVRRMLVNEYISWRRKWSRQVPVADVRLASREPDHAIRHAERAALTAQLATLTRTQRAVLAMRYFADLSDAGIADVLGCSVSTVRSHASRAMATLRDDRGALIPTDNGDRRDR